MGFRDYVELRFAQWQFGRTRADFYEDLAEALEDKGELLPHIVKLRARAADRKHRGLSRLYGRWVRRMDEMSFARAIDGTVPRTDNMILIAAETTGNLAEGLHFLSKAVIVSQRMAGSVQKAIAWPLILVLLLAGVLVAFALGMVPTMSQLYLPEKWPLMGRIVYYMSLFVVNYGVLFAIAVVAACVAFLMSCPRWAGPTRVRFDRYLPYSIYRDYHSGLFLVTLASLMKAGIALSEALIKIREHSTPWLRWHINRMLARLDRMPDNPALALDTGLFPRYLADRIADFGGRSRFQEAMEKVGIQGVDKVTAVVDKSSTVLNRGMIMVVGVVVGILVSGTLQTAMNADTALKAQARGVRG